MSSMFVPLPTPFRGTDGFPIANGLLFVTEGTNNNRASVYLDAGGTKPFHQWPYQLDNQGRASLWIPVGYKVSLKVFNSTGRLLLYSAQNVEGAVGSAAASSITTVASGLKTLTYIGGTLTQVDEFTDETRTTLKYRKVLNYTDGLLTSVELRDGELRLLNTKTLVYEGGQLISVSSV